MKKILLIITFAAIFVACAKEDTLTADAVLLGMGGDSWAKSDLDEWLYQEFVVPYNIDVKYKWDPYEVNLGKLFVPVEESKVKDLMSAVKKVWITPYETIAGSTFIKTLAPKRYVLVGSPEYNGTTLTLGFAEGGNKIALLNVNAFDKSSAASVRRFMQTVQHEFAHTLHQQVLYPTEFQTISATGYNGNWNSTPAAEFPGLGFISQYARANPNEDFAEMVRYLLLEGRSSFNAAVAAAGSEGGARLRAKETIVVNYFQQVWNINLYESFAGAQDGLVDLVQKAINDFVAGL